MKNKNQMEFGEVQESIWLMVEYDIHERRQSLRTDGKVTKTVSLDWGRFSSGNGMSIGTVVDFQKEANALLQSVKELLADGTYVKVTLTKSAHENVPEYEVFNQFGSHMSSLVQLGFESWTFEGNSLEEDPDDEGAGLYLRADIRYTNECWDMVLPWKQDILKSLAEAHL